jgi:hypothetical protein
MRLWTISDDKQEFDRHKTLVDGSLKHSLTVEMLNAALPKAAKAFIGKGRHIAAVHDGSDIRKEHSQCLESLGKVRSLSGSIVNGYQTMNTVLIDTERKGLRLLQSTPYSNRSAEYCSAATEQANKAKKKKTSAAPLLQESAAEYSPEATGQEQEETASEARIIREHLRCASETVRSAQPDAKTTHILDRKHDENALFGFIADALQDTFVIRLKVSRNSEEKAADETGKMRAVKLLARTYSKQAIGYFTKIRLGNRVFQDARLVLDYDTLPFGDHSYGVIRADYQDRTGTSLFPKPMLLITNLPLSSDNDAQCIFRLYSLRAQIEEVFHFLKMTLGWEDIQVRDWTSQQTLITLCFFIGGYFYEIESALTKNPNIARICELGGGKTAVTRTFFLRGLADLMKAQSVQEYFRHNEISQEDQDAMFAFVQWR